MCELIVNPPLDQNTGSVSVRLIGKTNKFSWDERVFVSHVILLGEIIIMKCIQVCMRRVRCALQAA